MAIRLKAKSCKSAPHGFTIAELLTVLVIITLLTAIVIAALSTFNRNQSVGAVAETVDAMLYDARSRSIASIDDTTYGVHFETTIVTLFEGDVYVASSTSNELYDFSATNVELSSINLGGAATSVYFERITGGASVAGMLQFEHVHDASQTRTLRVFSSGSTEIE